MTGLGQTIHNLQQPERRSGWYRCARSIHHRIGASASVIKIGHIPAQSLAETPHPAAPIGPRAPR